MLNKQGPDKIDWTDWTFNPISGCKHGCPYCYMLRMEKRFPGTMNPNFKPEYLERFEHVRKVKPGDKIFVGSSGDMWGEWVKDDHISQVIDVVENHPQYIFQFLTKNPHEYTHWDLGLLENIWLGTSVDGLPFTEGNLERMQKHVIAPVTFISFEPLLSKLEPNLEGIDWIIIGANSNRGAVKPPDEWAEVLIKEARRAGAAVWVKDNYKYHTRIKEFPK